MIWPNFNRAILIDIQGAQCFSDPGFILLRAADDCFKPRLCGSLGHPVQKWFFDLFAQGRSPKVSVLESKFSYRRHDSTISHEFVNPPYMDRGFFRKFWHTCPSEPGFLKAMEFNAPSQHRPAIVSQQMGCSDMNIPYAGVIRNNGAPFDQALDQSIH